ncbi:MAG: VOC family protein [Bdellovibrionota bacterium]
MFDHVMLMVQDKKRSLKFYEPVLNTLGHSLVHNSDEYSGFGEPGRIPLWLKQKNGERVSHHVHLAFSAASRSIVRQFYNIALELGGRSNGEPGVRPEHGENYYSAYVYDLDGHNIEAVCYQKSEA